MKVRLKPDEVRQPREGLAILLLLSFAVTSKHVEPLQGVSALKNLHDDARLCRIHSMLSALQKASLAGAARALQCASQEQADNQAGSLSDADSLLSICRRATKAIHRLPKGAAYLDHDEDAIRLPALVQTQELIAAVLEVNSASISDRSMPAGKCTLRARETSATCMNQLQWQKDCCMVYSRWLLVSMISNWNIDRSCQTYQPLPGLHIYRRSLCWPQRGMQRLNNARPCSNARPRPTSQWTCWRAWLPSV